MTETKQDLNKLSPFFEEINKYDEPKDKNQSQTDEMIGKASNRVLNEKWNIKIQTSADFFTELFRFIKEMGFNTVFGLTSRQIKIYKLNSVDNTHLAYITIDKTEVSEYINTDFVLTNLMPDISNPNLNKEENKDEENETLIYVEFDMLDELSFNNKYPVDIYFDTKERNTMYIVNAKSIESRRLNSTSIKTDPSLNTYKLHWDKMFAYIKNENMVDVTVSHVSLKNVLTSLEKKKTKKDKSSTGILKIKFGLSDIDFTMSTDSKSTSIQMYGDDIAIRGLREANIMLQLDFLVKFNKLNLINNVILHVYEKLPFIMETRFGAGNIRLYYVVSPRIEGE